MRDDGAAVDVRRVSDLPRRVRVERGVFIPLADGTRLAARLWLPDDAREPVPAVLEYLPYRLERRHGGRRPPADGVVRRPRPRRRARRHPRHRRVGRRLHGRVHGAGARRLPRGHRLDRGAAVVLGRGRDDGLLVERLQLPPGGGAAAARAAGDRLAATRRTTATPTTSTTAAASSCRWRWRTGRPACSAGRRARRIREVVGERWRELWLERLEQPPWVAHWLAHQRRDAYWQHGSVRDDYGADRCPVLCVGGLDGRLPDAALRLLRGARRAATGADRPLGARRPGPRRARAGGRASSRELVRWWDRWLKGVENGIDDEPMLVAYMQDSVAPAANRAERPGRFVAEDAWPSPRIERRALALGDGTLGEPAGDGRAADRQRPVRRPARRRLVRRRPLGRPAARPARRRTRARSSTTRRRSPSRSRSSVSSRRGSSSRPTARARSSPRGSASCSPTARRCSSRAASSTSATAARTPSRAARARPRRGRRRRAWTRSRTASRPAAGCALALSPCLLAARVALAGAGRRSTLRHGGGSALVLPGAAAAGGGRALRPPDPPAEPEPLVVEELGPGVGRRAADQARPRERHHGAPLRLGLRRARRAAERRRLRGHLGRDATRSRRATRCRRPSASRTPRRAVATAPASRSARPGR